MNICISVPTGSLKVSAGKGVAIRPAMVETPLAERKGWALLLTFQETIQSVFTYSSRRKAAKGVGMSFFGGSLTPFFIRGRAWVV